MSKKCITIFLILFFFCFGNGIYSQQQFGILPIGADINIAEDKSVSPSVDINFGYFSIDTYIFTDHLFYLWDFDLPIGIIWTPVNYRYLLYEHYWSFINFQVYWNILDLFNPNKPYEQHLYNTIFFSGAIFGPFASINYASNFNISNYIFCTGIRYNLTGMDHGNRFYLLNIEFGYRLINGDSKNYYFGINFDVIVDTFILLFNIDKKRQYRS